MNANKHSLRVTDYLGHMLDAIKLSRGYTRDLSKDEFIADRKTQQAVILNMVVIGEAATKLIDHYPTFAAQHPQIPWQKIRGMRNRLAHGYFDINLDIIWNTVEEAFPELEEQIRKIHS
jgi:uncharacterized protein with HEPN domain